MNLTEAKTILLCYRPGTADADDPDVAAALLLAKTDAELAQWLALHCARQELTRGKFRNLAAPAGLKEQIISEHAALRRQTFWRPRAVLAVLVVILGFLLAPYWWPAPRPVNHDTLADYQSLMAESALSGYGMALVTNDPVQIRHKLAQRQAPSEFAWPAGLSQVTVAGCAVEDWQNSHVAMICFRTGRPLPPGQTSDLWLFVADRAAIPDAPAPGAPRIGAAGKLTAAVWAQGDKVYLLGLQGDEALLRKFL